jgi:hypothetical protein
MDPSPSHQWLPLRFPHIRISWFVPPLPSEHKRLQDDFPLSKIRHLCRAAGNLQNFLCSGNHIVTQWMAAITPVSFSFFPDLSPSITNEPVCGYCTCSRKQAQKWLPQRSREFVHMSITGRDLEGQISAVLGPTEMEKYTFPISSISEGKTLPITKEPLT